MRTMACDIYTSNSQMHLSVTQPQQKLHTLHSNLFPENWFNLEYAEKWPKKVVKGEFAIIVSEIDQILWLLVFLYNSGLWWGF